LERPIDLAYRQITEISENEFGPDPEFGVLGKTSPEQLSHGIHLSKTDDVKWALFGARKRALFGTFALFGSSVIIDLVLFLGLGVRKTRYR
jgi:hypothetical protein